MSVRVSFSACGGAEGSRQKAWLVAPSKALRDVPQQPTGLLALNALASRYAGMSLPYGPTEQPPFYIFYHTRGGNANICFGPQLLNSL